MPKITNSVFDRYLTQGLQRNTSSLNTNLLPQTPISTRTQTLAKVAIAIISSISTAYIFNSEPESSTNIKAVKSVALQSTIFLASFLVFALCRPNPTAGLFNPTVGFTTPKKKVSEKLLCPPCPKKLSTLQHAEMNEDIVPQNDQKTSARRNLMEAFNREDEGVVPT